VGPNRHNTSYPLRKERGLAVSRRPITAEPRIRSRAGQREICGGKSAIESVAPADASAAQSASFHQYWVHTTIDTLLLPERQTDDKGGPLENNPLSEIGEYWIEDIFFRSTK